MASLTSPAPACFYHASQKVRRTVSDKKCTCSKRRGGYVASWSWFSFTDLVSTKQQIHIDSLDVKITFIKLFAFSDVLVSPELNSHKHDVFLDDKISWPIFAFSQTPTTTFWFWRLKLNMARCQGFTMLLVVTCFYPDRQSPQLDKFFLKVPLSASMLSILGPVVLDWRKGGAQRLRID